MLVVVEARRFPAEPAGRQACFAAFPISHQAVGLEYRRTGGHAFARQVQQWRKMAADCLPRLRQSHGTDAVKAGRPPARSPHFPVIPWHGGELRGDELDQTSTYRT